MHCVFKSCTAGFEAFLWKPLKEEDEVFKFLMEWQGNNISVAGDNGWDEKGSDVHDVCDDDDSYEDDDEDFSGTVLWNCKIFTASWTPFTSLNQETMWYRHAVICFRFPDVLLYSLTYLDGDGLKLMTK